MDDQKEIHAQFPAAGANGKLRAPCLAAEMQPGPLDLAPSQTLNTRTCRTAPKEVNDMQTAFG